MHHLPIFLFFLIIISTSQCKSPTPCGDILPIFIANDTIPKIEFKDSDERDSIISKFKEKFGDKICYEELEFAFPTPVGFIKTYFTLYCPIKTSSFPPKPEIQIMTNQHGKVLVNFELDMAVDTLSDWLFKNIDLEKTDDAFKKEVSIFWSIYSPVKNLERTATEITKGLSKKVNQLSNEKFEKDFCHLAEGDATAVLDSFPFKIVFDLGTPPPPPPPSSQIE